MEEFTLRAKRKRILSHAASLVCVMGSLTATVMENTSRAIEVSASNVLDEVQLHEQAAKAVKRARKPRGNKSVMRALPWADWILPINNHSWNLDPNATSKTEMFIRNMRMPKFLFDSIVDETTDHSRRTGHSWDRSLVERKIATLIR